jgi:hypothetical protein
MNEAEDAFTNEMTEKKSQRELGKAKRNRLCGLDRQSR